MQIEVSRLWLQNDESRIVATVFFYDDHDDDRPHNSSKVEVFIPMVDSLAEIKKLAIEKAREFLTEAISSTSTNSKQDITT
jgi:hypothetical protein